MNNSSSVFYFFSNFIINIKKTFIYFTVKNICSFTKNIHFFFFFCFFFKNVLLKQKIFFFILLFFFFLFLFPIKNYLFLGFLFFSKTPLVYLPILVFLKEELELVPLIYLFENPLIEACIRLSIFFPLFSYF